MNELTHIGFDVSRAPVIVVIRLLTETGECYIQLTPGSSLLTEPRHRG